MPKVKYIPCDIYKRGIHIFVGTVRQFKDWIVKHYTSAAEQVFVKTILSLPDDSFGMASFNFCQSAGIGDILIEKQPKTPKDIAALAHEILHATFSILNYCGVEYSYDGSNEAYTYLFEHLMRNALELEGYNDVEKERGAEESTP